MAHKHLDPGGLCLRSIVDDILPEHVVHNYPKLVHLLKLWADYIEHEHKSGYYLNRIQDQRNIDTIEEQFFIQLQKEIGAPIPQTFAAEPRLFYKQLKDLYISRGTKDSIITFFKLLYGDEVEIYYPGQELFAPSDGKWYNYRDSIIADRTKYKPLFTYTVSQSTNEISGVDDFGGVLDIDLPVVFDDDTYRDDYTVRVDVNNTAGTIEYVLVFDSPINAGSVITIYPEGAYTTGDGFVSDYKILQDSFFYQKFSYVLRTGTDINLWKEAFNRLVHPAGFIFFGEVVLFLYALQSRIPDEQYGYQVGGDPIPIVIPVTNAKSSIAVDLPVENEYHLTATNSGPGFSQSLEIIKFLIQDPNYIFGEYTIEEAINKAIDVKVGAEVTISS